MLLDVETRAYGDIDELNVSRSDLVGYFHPREIVADATLSVARKRALLAFWSSDFNAVRGVPALRRSGHGVTTTIDALKAALSQLDDAIIVPTASGPEPALRG
jgi:hypothetical protein